MDQAPADIELRNIIDKLAQFVARNGPEFEHMTKNKQKDNPKFSFLFGGEYFNYYQYKVTTEQAILKQKGINPMQNADPRLNVSQQQHHQSQPVVGNLPVANNVSLAQNNGLGMPPGTNPPPPNMICQVLPPNTAGPAGLLPQQNAMPNRSYGTLQSELVSLQSQQTTLQDQVLQSEQNLAAHHAALMAQQQGRVEDAVRQAQESTLQSIAQTTNTDLQSFDAVLQPIIDSCTKDSISAGKAWILQNSTTLSSNQVIAEHLLKRVIQETTFNHKLHIIYLVNDVLHHCARKKSAELRQAMESVVVPMFCNASLAATEEQVTKLNKLLSLWESKSNYFEEGIIEKLKDPTASWTDYQSSVMSQHASAITSITATTKQTYDNYQSQHQAFVNHAMRQIQSIEQQKVAIDRQLKTAQPPMNQPNAPSSHSLPPLGPPPQLHQTTPQINVPPPPLMGQTIHLESHPQRQSLQEKPKFDKEPPSRYNIPPAHENDSLSRFSGPSTHENEGPGRYSDPVCHESEGPGRFSALASLENENLSKYGGSHENDTLSRHSGSRDNETSNRYKVTHENEGTSRYNKPNDNEVAMRYGGSHESEMHGRYSGMHEKEGTNRFGKPHEHEGPGRYGGPLENEGSGRYGGPNEKEGTGRYGKPHENEGPGRYGGPHENEVPGRYSGPHENEGSNRYGGLLDSEGSSRYGVPHEKEAPGRYGGLPSRETDGPGRYSGIPSHENEGPNRFGGPGHDNDVTNRFGALPPHEHGRPPYRDIDNHYGGLPSLDERRPSFGGTSRDQGRSFHDIDGAPMFPGPSHHDGGRPPYHDIDGLPQHFKGMPPHEQKRPPYHDNDSHFGGSNESRPSHYSGPHEGRPYGGIPPRDSDSHFSGPPPHHDGGRPPYGGPHAHDGSYGGHHVGPPHGSPPRGIHPDYPPNRDSSHGPPSFGGPHGPPLRGEKSNDDFGPSHGPPHLPSHGPQHGPPHGPPIGPPPHGGELGFNQPPPNWNAPSQTHPNQALLPDFSKPPPGFGGPICPPPQNQPPPLMAQEIKLEDLMPTMPYFDLPAGLMVPLIKLEDANYKPIDPDNIRLPPPAPPNERLLAAVDQFYALPNHDSPRDSDGWEKLGLYEYYRAKNVARKRRDDDIADGIREKSRSPTPIERQSSKSPSPPKKRYRSKSRSRSRSKSPTRNRSRSRSPVPQRVDRVQEHTPITPNHRRNSGRTRRRRRNKSNSGSGSDMPPHTPDRRQDRNDRSPTPPSFLGSTYSNPLQQMSLDESNKGHQLLRKMGWGGAGLGANEQGIEAPISGGDVRDRVDQYKGVGVSLNDPYENFRKSKGQAFITRMKARAEERAEERADRD